MINDPQHRNIPEIRKLLASAFDDATLDAFSLGYFPEVYDRFSRGMRKDEKITLLLDHCRRQPAGFDELLDAVRNNRQRQFGRFEPYLIGDEPLLVSRVVSSTGLSDLLSELAEWKLIHNDLQGLLNVLNIPVDYLIKCRLDPSTNLLDEAGDMWQESCVPKLRSMPDKWNLQYAYTPSLNDLREQTYSIDKITRQLMQTDALDKEGLRSLSIRLRTIREIVWDLLVAADKKIMALVEVLQRMPGG